MSEAEAGADSAAEKNLSFGTEAITTVLAAAVEVEGSGLANSHVQRRLLRGDEVLPVLDSVPLARRSLTAVEVNSETHTGVPAVVLVVDDVPSIRRVVGILLERLGVRTLLAADGKEALSLLEQEPSAPAMGLIDLEMAGMGGIALTKELRRRDFSFPIYLFTSPTGSVPPIEDLKVEGYVFKPLVKRELGALLKRHKIRGVHSAGAESSQVGLV